MSSATQPTATLQPGGEKTYAVLVLHLLCTVALLLACRYEKQLSSRAYTWVWRVINLLSLICLVCSGAMMPRDLSTLIREFYTVPHPLCINDLDFTLRLLHTLWSLVLLFCAYTRPARTRKLTLSASCRYVALKYAYSYEQLMAICRKHRYPFFPIAELEQYARNIEAGDIGAGGENEPRAFVRGDIDHYLAEMDRQEEQLLRNEADYATQMRQARETYEANRSPLILARRQNATMSYEQYLDMKSQLERQD